MLATSATVRRARRTCTRSCPALAASSLFSLAIASAHVHSSPRSRGWLRPGFFRLFFFNGTATTEIYTLSLHDALPISRSQDPHSTGGGLSQARAAQLYERAC